MQKSQPFTSRISATSAANHIDCWSIPFLCGNTGSIARIFSGLEVRTRWGTYCVCEHPGSPQGADACGASGSSNCCQDVAAERAEDAGKWRIGSAGVAVCGGGMPAVRLYSNSPCGDEATHRWGCSHRTHGYRHRRHDSSVQRSRVAGTRIRCPRWLRDDRSS